MYGVLRVQTLLLCGFAVCTIDFDFHCFDLCTAYIIRYVHYTIEHYFIHDKKFKNLLIIFLKLNCLNHPDFKSFSL
jgi:hypothetical protein